ncbi:MAG TPA: YtxH domain-containing protein [Ferruginibacter sp.]|jgi:gas vesicle protein|nr:YtxH domain-containing protein [Ferruginibacter sp.]
MKSKQVIAGLLIGAAAGAALGVLFAPHKGSKTRRKIAGAGADLKESLTEKINDFVDSITDQFQHTKNDLMEKGKDKVASVKAQAKHSLS